MYGLTMGDTGHVLVIYGSCMGQVWVLCWSYMGHTCMVMHRSCVGHIGHIRVIRLYGSTMGDMEDMRHVLVICMGHN